MPSRNEIRFVPTPEEAASIPDSAWSKVDESEDYITWEAQVSLPNGLNGTIFRTEAKHVDELLIFNEELRKENSQRRFTAGMGSDKGGNMPMVHTASIPLNVYFRDFTPERKGDKDFSSWWRRQEQNKPFLVREKGFK